MKHPIPEIILLLILIFCFSPANAQTIHADFTTVVKQGCPPLEVTFINLSSSGSDINYTWILGNGNISNISEPYAVYTQPGFYDVTLIISNGTDTDTITKQNYIQVFSPPLAGLSVSGTTTGCAPLTINYFNTSVSGDAPIIYEYINYGDGLDSLSVNSSYTYFQQGVFVASIIIADTNGCTSSFTSIDTIETFKPLADFIADKTYSCSNPFPVQFENMSTGSENLSYLWNFGDGNTSQEINPSNNFSHGNFSVQLTIIDEHGCIDSIIKTNYIHVALLNSDILTTQDTGCANSLFYFSNNSLNSYDFFWDFGDNTYSLLQNASHSYTTPGIYIVKLVVSKNEQCKDSSYKNITIESVHADFDVNPRYACELPFIRQYSNNSSNAVFWEWRFGNKRKAYVQNPVDTTFSLTTLNYEQVFSDTLIAISTAGCRDTAISDSSYQIVLPYLNFGASIDNIHGCVPFNANIINNCTYNSTQDSFIFTKWTMLSGDIFQTNDFDYTFQEQGIFPITFYTETALGCSLEKLFFIKTGNPLNVNFELFSGIDTVCASEAVKFINTTPNSQNADNFEWSFSEGSISWSENPTIFFNDTGFISVTLAVSNNGCVSSALKNNYIYVKGPIAKVNQIHNCVNPENIQLIADVRGAELFSWNFGDNSPLVFNQNNISHSYPERGDYSVNFSASNNTNNCNYQLTIPVLVRKAIASFSVDTSYGCPGLDVYLDPTSSQDAQHDQFLNRYYWQFSDNNTSMATNGTHEHTFMNQGSHTIRLTVKDLYNCTSSVTKKIKIYNPEISFTSDYQQGCLPANFHFINNTNNDTTVSNIVWNFGDGATATETNPEHLYQQYGNYNVSLSVTNALNCASSLSKTDYIKVIKPDASFIANNPENCLNNEISFHDISQSNITTYLWNFGDGTTSTLDAPFHAYQDTGRYTVTLNITDNHGCDTSHTLDNYVYIQKAPEANFHATATSSDCYPSLINFMDNSDSPYLANWKWLFGDNTSITSVRNPNHVYSLPGNFDVTLISYTTNGCSDTISKQDYITIKGPWAKISAPDTICKNAPVALFATEKTNVHYLKWDAGNGLMSYNDSIVVSYNHFGNVYLSLLLFADSIHSCDKIISDSIHIFPTIADFTVNDNNYKGCVPFNTNFISTSVNGKIFNWYENSMLQSTNNAFQKEFTNQGVYPVKLVIQNNHNCKDSITKNITVFPLPEVKSTPDTMICQGSEALLKAGGALSYRWYPEYKLTNSYAGTTDASPDTTTNYTVTGTDSNNCKNSSQSTIVVYRKPNIILRDTTIVIGESIQINAFHPEFSNYAWYPADNISCTDCPEITFKPEETTTYYLTAHDTNNCFVLEFPIHIDISKKYSVAVPELFTPNGDGLNDAVFVRGWGVKEIIYFRI
ncbi:MAG: hypothetical protein A2309_11440, partial [Bacteroidetes bacterium RIFOXYB2_FULL_35_7]